MESMRCLSSNISTDIFVIFLYFIEYTPSMQKRDQSIHKLPKIAPSEETLSSKLYSLTGLRIFQAKFMEELRYPRQHLKLNQMNHANN